MLGSEASNRRQYRDNYTNEEGYMWGKGVEMRSSADHRAGTRKKRLLAKALTAAAVI